MNVSLNDNFHIGNFIKRHIYLRNKTVKDVAEALGLNEKTFSDHLNSAEIKSNELFRIATYLEISLDYINYTSNSKGSLYGLKVYRLNEHSKSIARTLVENAIAELKMTETKDFNYIIDELRKQFNGIGYVIDAILPLKDKSGYDYELYVKNSNRRGFVNTGEFVIFPPYGKDVETLGYNDCLNGQDGKTFLKLWLKDSYIEEDDLMIYDLDAIHKDYEEITKTDIKRLWNGHLTIRNSSGDLIAYKQLGVGRTAYPQRIHFSRAEYFYIKGMMNVDRGNNYAALIDFNTALHIYHDDWSSMFDLVFYNDKLYDDGDVYFNRDDCCEFDNVFPESDIYLGKIKILQRLGEYELLIKTVEDLKAIEEYELAKTDKEFITDILKALLDAHIKIGDFEKALLVCEELKNNIDFHEWFNMQYVFSLVYEKNNDFLNAFCSLTYGAVAGNDYVKQKSKKRIENLKNFIQNNLYKKIEEFLTVGEYNKAIELCNAAKLSYMYDDGNYLEKLDDRTLRIIDDIKMMMVKLYVKAENFDKAKEVCEELKESRFVEVKNCVNDKLLKLVI